MKKLALFPIFAFSCLFTFSAHAIFEAKLTYSLLASKPNFSQLYSGSTSLPSAAANYGLGADVLVFIPLTGFGAGLRYEDLGATASGSGLDFKSKASRTAILVAYRFIDTLIHVGPIFSYGISHTSSMKVTDTNNSTFNADWSPGSTSSYQLGLDVGAGLLGFNFGAEAGIQNMKWSKMKDATGNSTSQPDTDMSGTYAKVYFGFGI